MSPALVAHSWVRFPVLLMALVFFAYCVWATAQRRAAGKLDRILGGIFVGLVDLQVLLGVILAATGHGHGYEAHMGLMLGALVVAHVASVRNRRRASPPSWAPALLAGAVLALLVAGVLLNGRGLFGGVVA